MNGRSDGSRQVGDHDGASRALRLALVYAVAGAAWILGSDWLLGALMPDPELRQQIGAFKGWAFVGVTAVLLYGLLRRQAGPSTLPDSRPLAPRRIGWLALVLGALVVAATAQLVRVRAERFDASIAQQVASMATLRAREVAHWLLQRRERAWQVQAASSLHEPVARWLRQRDAATLRTVLDQLAALPGAVPGEQVALFDAEGRFLGGDHALDTTQVPQALVAAVRQALASGRVEDSALYGTDLERRQTWLDVVAPLPGSGAQVAVVFRANAASGLLPQLRRWTTDIPSATSLLVRVRGEHLVGVFGAQPMPLSTPDLLAARAVRGELLMGQVAQGRDFRGVAVIGAVQQIGRAHV